MDHVIRSYMRSFSQRAVSNVNHHGHGHVGYPHDSKIWADVYLKQFRFLCASSPRVMEWIEEHVLRDTNHSWLIPLVGTAVVPDVEDLSRKIVIVSEAGVPEITGQYIFSRLYNGACLFEKIPILFRGKCVKFSMYRCKLQNKKYAWFISYRDDDGNPGDAGDFDFYSAPALYVEGREDTNDVLPPTSTWELITDHGVAPAPEIAIIDGDIMVGDAASDSDGSMRVVMDDESSSQNDTDPPALSPNDDSLDMDDYPTYNAI